MKDSNGRLTPDNSMTLNISAEEREFLLEAVIAGVDHLSHQSTNKDDSQLREHQDSITSKLMRSQDTDAKK